MLLSDDHADGTLKWLSWMLVRCYRSRDISIYIYAYICVYIYWDGLSGLEWKQAIVGGLGVDSCDPEEPFIGFGNGLPDVLWWKSGTHEPDYPCVRSRKNTTLGIVFIRRRKLSSVYPVYRRIGFAVYVLMLVDMPTGLRCMTVFLFLSSSSLSLNAFENRCHSPWYISSRSSSSSNGSNSGSNNNSSDQANTC